MASKIFFLLRHLSFLKDQQMVEDKIKLNLLDDDKRITNKDIDKYFDDFFTVSYSVFNTKKTIYKFSESDV